MRVSASVRLAAAGWIATMLASMTIFPLVQGGGWWIALGLIAAVTSGAGLLARRFTAWDPLVVAVQVVTWVVAMTLLFLPHQAWAGVLPGPDAIDQGRLLFEEGLRVMHRAAPPVDDTTAVIFVTAGGLTLIALVVDVLAVTLRRPAVAGLPLLAVYCVPAAVLPDGLPWPYFLLAALGFLVLVGVDSVDRVQAWGRVLAGTDADGRSAITFGNGARKIASVSLAVAVVLPLLVPGLGERVLGERSGTGTGAGKGGTAVVVNPLLQLRQDLQEPSDAQIMTYTTDMTDPQPLRMVVEDEFTGDVWQSTVSSVPQDQQVANGVGDPEGLAPNVQRTPHTTTIKVGSLAESYLPLPYPWTSADPPGNWYYDDSTRTVVGVGSSTQGIQYKVDHFTVDATTDQLRAAPAADPGIEARYTQLPDIDPEIAKIAAAHAGSGSKFDQAERLRDWLRTFQYSLQAPGNGTNDSSSDVILEFLRQQKGYCVHFAAAMAVMARTLKIPARVVVGFLPGTKDAQGTWTVRVKDAHAWPELYFQDYGWVRFEPTPSQGSQGVGDVVNGFVPQQQPTATATAQPTASASSTSGRIKGEDPNPDETPLTAAGSAAKPGWQRIAAALPWPWIALGLVLLLVAAAPSTALALARRSRWRRVGSRAGRAEAALDELVERLEDLGLHVSPAWTPRGLRQWLVGAEHVPPSRTAALDRLVGEVESARYAPPGGEGPPAEELRRDVLEVVAVVAEQVPAGRRRLARLLPASGIAALGGAARRAESAADGAGRRAMGQVDEVRKLVGGRRR